MAEFNQNFNMFQGDTKDLEIRVTDEDGPMDLTGSTIVWRLYRSIKGPELIRKTVENGGIEVIDNVGGVFMVHLASEDTEVPGMVGKYQHEAVITDVRGYVATVLTGQCVIQENYGG